MAAISDEAARDVFEGIFREHGLPQVIRSDNGTPFASTGLAGLTKLSVYLVGHRERVAIALVAKAELPLVVRAPHVIGVLGAAQTRRA